MPDLSVDPTQLPTPTPPPVAGPPTTQSYLDAISKIKATGGVLPKVNWSALPDSVDKRQIVSAYIDGLPDAHANFVNAAAMGGQTIPSLNLSKVPGYTPTRPEGGIYQDYPIRRAISRYALRPAAEIIGQGVGGVFGAAVGTPEAPGLGTAALGLAGATAGGTAADELMNKADEAMGLQHPETQLPGQAPKRVGMEALTNAAMVGGGKVAGKVASELAAPFAESVNPEVQTAAKSLDIPLTASQQSNSKLLAQGEQMAAKLPGSSGILGDFYAKTRARMMDVANSLFGKQMNPQIAAQVGDSINSQLRQKVNDLGQSGVTPQLDPADVGNSVASDISNFSKSAMTKSSGRFEALKNMMSPSYEVPLTSTAQQAAKLKAQQTGGLSAAQNPQLMSVLNDLVPENPIDKSMPIGNLPSSIPTVSVPQLIKVRSQLGDLAAQGEGAFSTNQPGTKFMGTPISGAYKSLINSIDEDLGQIPGNFGQQYQSARTAHAAMTSTMGNPYIKSILSADQPEKIVDLAVRRGDVSNLATLKGMVSPDTYEQLGNAFKNKLIENSQNADGQFIPQKLFQQIKQYGEPTITQAIGSDGLNGLKQLSNLSDGSFADPNFRQFISDLGRKNGENVSGMLLGASPQNINRVRALIGENSFGEAQDGMIHNLLTNNQDNVDFGGLAKRMSQIPPESLSTAISPDKLSILNRLATVGGGIKASQKEFMNPSGTAPMMGTFFILRQLFSNPLNAMKVLGGLSTGTEAYTSAPVTKYLTQGAMAPETAETIGSTVAKGPVSVFGNTLSNPYKNRQKR